EQHGGGTAAATLLVHQIEVTKDAVEHERNGEAEMHGPEVLRRFTIGRVEDVRNERRCRDDGNHLVEQIRRILLQDASVPDRAVAEKRQFVTTLTERQEERQQCRADEQ